LISFSSRNTGVKGTLPILDGSVLIKKWSIVVLPLTVSFSMLERLKRLLKEEIIRPVCRLIREKSSFVLPFIAALIRLIISAPKIL
jgi:hypothetical protein